MPAAARCAARGAQQIGADGVEQVVALERQGIETASAGAGTVDLGERDGAVQRRRRGPRGERDQLVVEREDLPPVGVLARVRGVAVDRVDRRLDLVGPGLVRAAGTAHDRLALGDQAAIPAAAVLVGQAHEAAVGRRARAAPSLDQQHQRQQAHHLRLVGHQLAPAAAPSRIASAQSSSRTSCSPALAA